MGFAKGPDRVTDNMKSSWRNDRSVWGLHHWSIHLLNIYHTDAGKPVPVFQKTDKIPYLTQWSLHRWILWHALWPIMVQNLHIWYYGKNFGPWTAGLFYTLAFQLNAIHQLWALRRMGHKFGYLDGDKHARDEVPDVGVTKVFNSLHMTTIIRPAVAIFMCYRSSAKASLSWWLPIELGLYPVVLDFFFYFYHRACHENDSLWKYHRTHHLTKHPNPLLSSYADTEQEFIEIALIPFLTYGTLKLAGFPMPFHDWWICHSYILFTEAFGHSGLRLWGSPAGTSSWILRYLNCELTIEDHDMHHRKGWKQSHNYGKATRVWDRIFGTCGERVEGFDENIDLNRPINFPAF
nr:fatty acid hydroxylase vlma [Quercus suber]